MPRHKTKRHTHIRGGGLFTRRKPETKSKRHVIQQSACNKKDVPCDIFDTRVDGTINPMWHTCLKKRGINYHIKYITPANMLIKSVESAQIPHFNVAMTTNLPAEYKLKIEDKFVSCFLKICGEWYAVMRLFGKTLNDGILALTVRNRVFYRVNTERIKINEETGVISISPESVKQTNEYYIFKTKQTPILNISISAVEHVDRKHNEEVFRVLNTFRIQKIVGNAMKYNALGELLDIGN